MNEKDLSWKEDLSCGVMNLINLEEHIEHSFIISSNDKWINLLNEVRKIRTYCMKVILEVEKKDARKILIYSGDLIGMYYWLLEEKIEGEFWCCLKHLLASSMRLSEVSTKFLEDSYVDLDKGFFDYIKKGIKKMKGGDDKNG